MQMFNELQEELADQTQKHDLPQEERSGQQLNVPQQENHACPQKERSSQQLNAPQQESAIQTEEHNLPEAEDECLGCQLANALQQELAKRTKKRALSSNLARPEPAKHRRVRAPLEERSHADVNAGPYTSSGDQIENQGFRYPGEHHEEV